MGPAHQSQLPLPRPFELPLALRGHGWIALAPHRWAGGDRPWRTLLRIDGQVVAAGVRQRRGRLVATLQGTAPLSRPQLAQARRQLAHMLQLDGDLTEFWQLCRLRPELAWVARRGGGRLLRSATVFEDLMKLLFTTNCSWALTEALTRNLVTAAGPRGPAAAVGGDGGSHDGSHDSSHDSSHDGEVHADAAGAHAFPTAAECDRGEAFFRDVVRAGYRSRACAELAARFASGELYDEQFLDPELPTGQLRDRLLSLRGFGPYAAGQAMRLLGRYDDLALDSWCRAALARLLGRRAPPDDAFVARRYRGFGRFAGLAMWCELTADWHGEGRAASPLAVDGAAGASADGAATAKPARSRLDEDRAEASSA